MADYNSDNFFLLLKCYFVVLGSDRQAFEGCLNFLIDVVEADACCSVEPAVYDPLGGCSLLGV